VAAKAEECPTQKNNTKIENIIFVIYV